MNQAFLTSDIAFWLTWILIPLFIEIIPATFGFVLLLFKEKKHKIKQEPEQYPEITILIPVYNSSKTLESCIASINYSSYDNDLITILLIDNGTTDNSKAIFEQCQIKYDISMQWLTSNQGKSKALNKGLFNSHGKYIINIDSDGCFETNSIKNLINKFESDKSLHCLTGVIMTNNKLIEETEYFWLRQIRKLEYIEYCQSFLVGRNYNASVNSIFSIAGAYSAFKKSAILNSFLYNSNTICEDAHITHQIKSKKLNVGLCEDAIFYVEPIDNLNKMYVQRQRWQIGQLEVFNMFHNSKLNAFKLLKERSLGVVLFDHTFAFPRLIWYFALIALSIINYPIMTITKAVSLIYALYIIIGLLYSINIRLYLKNFTREYRYYNRLSLYMLIYPLYNFYTFVLRFMGIINCISRKSSWKTVDFTDEKKIFKDIVKNDFKKLFNFKKETSNAN